MLVEGDEGPRHKPRFRARFNQVYQSEGFGMVTVWFAGGRSGTVRILVGEERPPEQLAGEAMTEMNGFASAVVRPGEYWTLQTKREDGGGFKALFTPLF